MSRHIFFGFCDSRYCSKGGVMTPAEEDPVWINT